VVTGRDVAGLRVTSSGRLRLRLHWLLLLLVVIVARHLAVI